MHIAQLSLGSTHEHPQNTEDIPTHRGTLQIHHYKCSVHGPKFKRMYVYLPETYYDNSQHYPVVYFLHGANGNEESWIVNGQILNHIDSLTYCQEICKCIYVFPNTNRYYHDFDYIGSRPKRSIEAYFDLNGSAEHSFINDIMNYVDENFRTIPFMQYRAIAGLSIGGLQALYITANTTNSFGYIGLFSPIIYPPINIGSYSYIYRSLEQKLYKQFSTSPSLYLIMIGEDDPFYKSAYVYREMLTKQKYNFIFITTDGGHTWDNWGNYSIQFLKSLWDVLPQETQ